MIIDQLPLLDGDPQDADEMPIERGVTTYKAKLTQLAASILAKLVKDSAPTADSTNPVESGGVYRENQRIEAAKQDKITATGILKGDGTGAVSAAVAGTDYLTPATAYSPIGDRGGISAYSIVPGDIGKTLTFTGSDCTITLTQEASSQIPIGAEIALLMQSVTPGVYLTISVPNGRMFGASAFTTVKVIGGYSLVTIKKLWNASAGDVWLITGAGAEVVS